MNKWSVETYSILRKEEVGYGAQLYFLRLNKGSQRPQQRYLKQKALRMILIRTFDFNNADHHWWKLYCHHLPQILKSH